MVQNTIQELHNSNKTLTYKNSYQAPQSSYVRARKLDSITPISGSSAYTPNSTRRISWRLPAGSFADMNDSFFSFVLQTTGTALEAADTGKKLTFHGAHTLFERLVVSIGGVVAEDISNYNVIEECLHQLTGNDDYTNCPIGYAQGLTVGAVHDWRDELEFGQQFVFKPRLSGILNNDKYLPLSYMPEVVIDLYLADAATVFDITGYAAPSDFSYQLSDVSLKLPYVEFDDTFTAGFEASLQQQPLKYQFDTFSNFVTTLTTGGGDYTIGSFKTDIKSLFSLVRAAPANVEADSFAFTRSDINSYQLSLGTMRFPLQPIHVDDNKLAEGLVYTTQAVANFQDQSLGMNVSYNEWGNECWLMGLDLAASDASKGGIDSTLTYGSPLMLNVKGNAITNNRMDSFIHYGSIMEIMADRSVVITF